VTALHESTGCYALDALEKADLAEFEAHKAACPSCNHEIAQFRETAAELTTLIEIAPPPELRDYVLSAVRNTPQLPANSASVALAVPPTPMKNHSTGPRRALPGSEIPGEPEPSAADDLALRRQRRRNSVLTGLVAAMLALLVGLGGVVYSLFQQREDQITQMEAENELYRAPDTKTVVVDISGGGQATFVASKQLNRALFIGTGLPDPGPDNRYQLWTMTGQEPKWKTATRVSRDNQIADPGSGGKVFFSGDIAGADFLCVNLEPLSNTTSKPSSPPLAAAEI
jgi:hypothetical protein